MSFVEWNTELLRHFFGPAWNQCSQVLSVGAEELDEIAPHLNGYEGLLQAVRTGAPWVPRRNPHGNPTIAYRDFGAGALAHQRTHLQQHSPTGYIEPADQMPYGRGRTAFPQYLPIIAALVSIYTENDVGGFYLAARNTLDLPEDWNGDDLGGIVTVLFDDLRNWSHQETNGDFGLFHAKPLGLHPFVSWLRGQSIIRRTDEPRLQQLYWELGLTPEECLTPNQKDGLLARICRPAPNPFSIGLQAAAGDVGFHDALFRRLDFIRNDWDGSAPQQNQGPDPVAAVPQQRNHRTTEVKIILFLNSSPPIWSLGLLIPAHLIEDGEEFNELVWIDRLGIWNATSEKITGDVIASPAPNAMADLTALESLLQRPDHTLQVSGCRSRSVLVHRDIRYFIPGVGRLIERDCLPDIDRDVYILVSPQAAAGFGVAIDAHNAWPLLELLPPLQQSLPFGWQLFHARNSQRLVALGIPLPDGRPQHNAFRPVVLTGGSPVTRAGQRFYLPYDLPSIEVAVSGDVWIECVPFGLQIIPSSPTPYVDAQYLGTPSLHRYDITAPAASAPHYSITARNAGGNIIGNARIGIADWDLAPSVDAKMGLAPEGRSVKNGPRMCGFDLLEIDPHQALLPTIATAVGDLGDAITAPDPLLEQLHTNPVAQFLNWLALRDASFVPYGNAQRKLYEFTQAANASIPASIAFRALRRRGLAEIITDSQGRWCGMARLPASVTRTSLALGGAAVSTASGTLSFHDWGNLLAKNTPIYQTVPHDRLDLPAIRFVNTPEYGPESSAMPGALLDFSPTLDELESSWHTRGGDHDRGYEQEFLNCANATWAIPDSSNAFLRRAIWTLWRIADPYGQTAHLRRLRRLDNDGQTHWSIGVFCG
jgi:hypothetical protein